MLLLQPPRCYCIRLEQPLQQLQLLQSCHHSSWIHRWNDVLFQRISNTKPVGLAAAFRVVLLRLQQLLQSLRHVRRSLDFDPSTVQHLPIELRNRIVRCTIALKMQLATFRKRRTTPRTASLNAHLKLGRAVSLLFTIVVEVEERAWQNKVRNQTEKTWNNCFLSILTCNNLIR